ncbi:VOC family protein [Pseudohalocynthiibacter aestuariivivens]|jgi:catechol 2,3-dioxygenase-like lactoylglutathione lyase family enzyme|uniref:VOC family protein n=1 Tax=Pseudohalocynthiibacter aestuariivivens TaxID=1591409 RepID=A0ABV5JH35_9RHOB|nr:MULTISPECIES: VOC family protein [Pseudohalocynthiibacter]MBS9718463.1 VOC family protein [Pseudohalocynthiibacter aestuariivivens]MCK0104068.1 VOC family protein [Pseudohalocynthiibacter sp. F2068]
MAQAVLEHANITVTNVQKTADMLCKLFDWKIRWASEPGESMDGGTSFHVGSDESYLALYTKGGKGNPGDTYTTIGGLNHIGVVVDDLDLIEGRVREMGFVPNSHADYEPGRRFYFDDLDGIEIEVVSYNT